MKRAFQCGEEAVIFRRESEVSHTLLFPRPFVGPYPPQIVFWVVEHDCPAAVFVRGWEWHVAWEWRGCHLTAFTWSGIRLVRRVRFFWVAFGPMDIEASAPAPLSPGSDTDLWDPWTDPRFEPLD